MPTTTTEAIDDVDTAGYFQHIDKLAGWLTEPQNYDLLIVLGAIEAGDIRGGTWSSEYGVTRLALTDLDTIGELTRMGLAAGEYVTDKGRDVLRAAR